MDRTGKAKSQASGSKSLFEKVKQYLGPASAALIFGGAAFYGMSRMGDVGGSTPEAPGTALTQ